MIFFILCTVNVVYHIDFHMLNHPWLPENCISVLVSCVLKKDDFKQDTKHNESIVKFIKKKSISKGKNGLS